MPTGTKKKEFVPKRRMNVILLFFCLLFASLLARIFILQIVSHGEYAALAAKQHRVGYEIQPHRGSISAVDKDGNLHLIAGNHIVKYLASSPAQIGDPGPYAHQLSPILGVSEQTLLEKLDDPEDTYELIAKDLGEETISKEF